MRTASMRAVIASGYGTAEVLSVQEVPIPEPSDSELLVGVEASSLNALDWHLVTGTPYLVRLREGLRRPKRLTPGADFAGTVVKVGKEVTRFLPGDLVFGECQGGGCAEFVTVDAESAVALPPNVSFEAGGATPVAGLTALQGLRTHGAIQPGESVLINGAAGGVGTFAVQIAQALGAEVTAVCSARNVEMVRALGADTVIDYGTTDFVVGGARFDVMLDNVGNRSPADCLAVLRSGARFVAVSGPKTNRWLGPVPHIIHTAMVFRRSAPSFHQFTAQPSAADLTFLGELLAEGKVSPSIDRVIGLEDVADGLTEIGSGHTRAKIVVKPA